MYFLNVWLTVKDARDIERVAEALARAGAKSKMEPGCDRWEAYQSEAEPARFLLVERWQTLQHWEEHRQGEAVQEIYLKEVIPLVERAAHPSRRIC